MRLATASKRSRKGSTNDASVSVNALASNCVDNVASA